MGESGRSGDKTDKVFNWAFKVYRTRGTWKLNEGGILILVLLYRFITVISREVALQRGKRKLRQFYCQIAKRINAHNKSEEL